MSSKAKVTQHETQQQKLELRSVKKKNLFKSKGPTSKNVAVTSPSKRQLKDEVTKKRAEKKPSEFARQIFHGTLSVHYRIVLTKEDLELLKLFDHNRDYGPCIGTFLQ